MYLENKVARIHSFDSPGKTLCGPVDFQGVLEAAVLEVVLDHLGLRLFARVFRWF